MADTAGHESVASFRARYDAAVITTYVAMVIVVVARIWGRSMQTRDNSTSITAPFRNLGLDDWLTMVTFVFVSVELWVIYYCRCSLSFFWSRPGVWGEGGYAS